LPIPFFIRLLFQESGYKPDVVSHDGAQGIAQFMPETASRVGLENPFDPMQAIAASARLLRDLVKQFGNIGLAAAAYNAGPRRIQDWLARKGKLPEEPQHYVKTITGRAAENWKAAAQVTPLQNLPRQAPCQEAAGVIASSNPQIDYVATRARTALARAKAPVHGSAKRERGSTPLAASSKKRHQKVHLPQR
jgi:Transglycosylase SLT domain